MKLLKQDSKLLSTKFQQSVSATDIRDQVIEGLGIVNIQDQVSKGSEEGTNVVSRRTHEEFRPSEIQNI